jgi:reductive dehalogenase
MIYLDGVIEMSGSLVQIRQGVSNMTGARKTGGRAYQRAWWIRSVNRPTVGETTAEYQRFSGDDMFAIYRRLKEAREGAGAFDAEQAARASRVRGWMQQQMPGNTLRDRQLNQGAWTLMHSTEPGAGLLSWTRVHVQTPAELGVEAWNASPEEAAVSVKAAARLYGGALVGIAPLNVQYVNLRQMGREIVFTDDEIPSVSDCQFAIPKRMRWCVVLAIPMDLDLLARAPTAAGEAAAALGYSQSVFAVASLAEFIRGLGYHAIPMVNDTAQSVPFAIDAGLGELGRLNKLVTPEFGPAVRLCKVFTDLPMRCDRPIDFGLAEFCRKCRQCAEACPVQALSFDAEPSFQIKGPWNNPGHEAWFEDSYKCFEYWQQMGTGCGICLAECPFTLAARAWSAEAAKVVTSLTAATDGLFRTIDQALDLDGENEPEGWWRAR